MSFEPMTCPACHGPMNRHAEKAVPPTTAEEAARADPAFGGILHELHACPRCGAEASRPGS